MSEFPGTSLAALVAIQSAGTLQDVLDVLVESMPAAVDPSLLALYGGGGLGGFLAIRTILGRLRGSTQEAASTPEATTATSVATTSTGSPPGTSKPSVAFTLPSVLPLSRGIREVTHDEIHALQLGAVVGFIVTWLFSLGRTDLAVGIVVAFLGGALGFRRYASKAVKTVRMEPWYALLALLAGAGAGYVFFGAEPAVVEAAIGTLEVVLP